MSLGLVILLLMHYKLLLAFTAAKPTMAPGQDAVSQVLEVLRV